MAQVLFGFSIGVSSRRVGGLVDSASAAAFLTEFYADSGVGAWIFRYGRDVARRPAASSTLSEEEGIDDWVDTLKSIEDRDADRDN